MRSKLSLIPVTIFLLSACTGSGAPSAAPPTAGPTTATNTAAPPTSIGGEVVVVDGGGRFHDAAIKSMYEPFQAATGIKITTTSYDYETGTIQAQVRGAKQWDIVNVGNPISNDLQAQLFLPIDYSIVAQPGLPQSAQLKYELIYTGFAHVLGYRTDKYSTAPTSWADLWDTTKFPGTRQMNSYPIGTLEVALLADGVDPKSLYPIDVDRAFAKLDKLLATGKIVWYGGGAASIENFANETATIGIVWNGRMGQAQAQGIPVDFIMPGALVQPAIWSALSTAPHPRQAMEFLKYVASANVQAAEANGFPGELPSNVDAYTQLDPAVADRLPTNPKFASVIGPPIDWDWWNVNADAVNAKWQEWFTKLK
jgi:putative spermidine/putrescine transport system substrate-binding protein